MIFESLYESAERGELLTCEGGFLRYHRRRDHQATIHELLIVPEARRKNHAQQLLRRLLEKEDGIVRVAAKCPADLESGNAWYLAMGFTCERTETTPTGRKLNVWILEGRGLDPRLHWRYDD